MSGGCCFNGCDCEECVCTVAGDCGCFTGIGVYHFGAVAIEGNQP